MNPKNTESNQIETEAGQPVQTEQQPGLPKLGLDHFSSSQVANRGFVNGILGITKEHFDHFITASEQRERLIVYKDFLQSEQQRVKNALHNFASEKEKYELQDVSSASHLQALESKTSQIHQQQILIGQQIESTQHEKSSIPISYGVLATLLYFFGGLVFMLTDYSITKNIAKEAFDLKNTSKFLFNLGEVEVFALGMSMLAVVLKPLVDRVFEQPYLDESNRRRMFSLLAVTGILVVIALGTMGSYRTTVKHIENQETANDKAISLIDRNIISGTLTEVERQRLVKQRKELRGMSTKLVAQHVNKEARVIFILSSILFAVAGAICLSISIPSIRQHWKAARLSFRTSQLRIKQSLQTRQLTRISSQRTQLSTDQKLAVARIPTSEEKQQLQEELSKLRREEQNVLGAISNLHIQAQQAWYHDNYDRGNQYQPIDQGKSIKVDLKEADQTIESRIVRRPGGVEGIKTQNKSYLHQKLRHILNTRIKNNQQYSNKNGKHN